MAETLDYTSITLFPKNNTYYRVLMYVTGSTGHISVKNTKSNSYGILILILLKVF